MGGNLPASICVEVTGYSLSRGTESSGLQVHSLRQSAKRESWQSPKERVRRGTHRTRVVRFCPRDLDLLSGRPNIASCILAADLPEQLRAHQRSRCLAPAHTKGLAAMISAAPGATGDCREWRPTLSTRRLGRIRDSHGSWTCAAPTVRHFRQCERRGNRADLRLRPHKLRANARCPAGGARFRNAPQRLF